MQTYICRICYTEDISPLCAEIKKLQFCDHHLSYFRLIGDSKISVSAQHDWMAQIGGSPFDHWRLVGTENLKLYPE